MSDAILGRLDAFIAHVATISPQIWLVYVKQQYMEAISGFLCLLVCFMVFILVGRFLMRNWNNDIENNILWTIREREDYGTKEVRKTIENEPNFILVICGFISIASLIGSIASLMFSIWEGLPQLINPQYYAIKDLINMVK